MDIDISKSLVDCSTTFISLQNSQRFNIINRSNYNVEYKFSLFKNNELDVIEKQRLHEELERIEQEECSIETRKSKDSEEILSIQRKYRNVKK